MPLADLVVVIKGGNSLGTWMHEDVAARFSLWLSYEFSVWFFDQLKGVHSPNPIMMTTIDLKPVQSEPSKIEVIVKQNKLDKNNFLDAYNTFLESKLSTRKFCERENYSVVQFYNLKYHLKDSLPGRKFNGVPELHILPKLPTLQKVSTETNTMTGLQEFSYNGNPITFQTRDGEIMLNHSEMANPFGKQPADFLRLDQTKKFIEILEKQSSIGKPIVNILNGGNSPGTWGTKKLALKFAAWLNPHFELWVYDRIDELMRHGATAINPNDLLNPDFIIRLATELKNERESKKILKAENEYLKLIGAHQADWIRIMKPKELFADSVVTSILSYMVSELAKILKILDQTGNPAVLLILLNSLAHFSFINDFLSSM